jgi:CubicO group peptidase (beta-lactamase class C family)
VLDLRGGWADQARTVSWTAQTTVNTFSISKALIAFALLMLVDRGRLSLDEPVSRYWPEFARHGKQRITVREVLSHQAGLPTFPRPRVAQAAAQWDLLVGDLADAAPQWPAGTAHAEHAWTYGHLVGELIRRVDGRAPGRFLREELAQPWDLDLALGLDEAAQRRAAELEYGDPNWARRIRGAAGSLRERAVTNPAGWLELPVLNSPLWRSAEVPAANIHATATGCARFYAGLLASGELDGVRLISPDLAAQMCRVHTRGQDLVLERPVNWGLGVQVDPDRGEIGMGGISGSYAFAHPRLSYSFAFLTRSLHDHQRVTTLINALNACLS